MRVYFAMNVLFECLELKVPEHCKNLMLFELLEL
jgi:hypothetical protein